MATEARTKPTSADPKEFLQTIDDPGKWADAFRLLELMQGVTSEPPIMWGPAIVGFGSYSYRYPSGHGGTYLATGFSPRKSALTIYIMQGFTAHPDLMQRLGRYKTDRSCLYVKRLSDIDEAVLEELVRCSLACLKETYPTD